MMPTRVRTGLAGLICAALFGACSAAPDMTTSLAPGPVPTAALTASPGDQVTQALPAPGPTATAPPDGVEEPLFDRFDTTVVLLTQTSGGGSRPLLEWQPVEGADHYGVYVYAPNGRACCAWAGRGTSIHVGGEPQLLEHAPGPSIAVGMSWAVIAYDANLLPLAVSELRPIDP